MYSFSETENYANVAFPYRVLASPEEVVNFELRNYNPYKKKDIKDSALEETSLPHVG